MRERTRSQTLADLIGKPVGVVLAHVAKPCTVRLAPRRAGEVSPLGAHDLQQLPDHQRGIADMFWPCFRYSATSPS